MYYSQGINNTNNSLIIKNNRGQMKMWWDSNLNVEK